MWNSDHEELEEEEEEENEEEEEEEAEEMEEETEDKNEHEDYDEHEQEAQRAIGMEESVREKMATEIEDEKVDSNSKESPGDYYSDVSKAVHHRFAEYILVTAIPWPSPDSEDFYSTYGRDNVEKLLNIYRKLCDGTFLFDEETQCFHGPPGYENVSIPINSTEGRNYVFSQHNIAIFISNLAKGVKRTSALSRRLHLIWRSRNSQKWAHPDPEKELRKDNPSSYAFDEIRQTNSFAGHPDEDDDEKGEKDKREEQLLTDFLNDMIQNKKLREHDPHEPTLPEKSNIYGHLFQNYLTMASCFKSTRVNRMGDVGSIRGNLIENVMN